MRLLEDLLQNANRLKLLIVCLLVIDLMTLSTYLILDIVFFTTHSPDYSSHLTIFIVEDFGEILLTILIILSIIYKKIMPLIFSTIM